MNEANGTSLQTDINERSAVKTTFGYLNFYDVTGWLIHLSIPICTFTDLNLRHIPRVQVDPVAHYIESTVS